MQFTEFSVEKIEDPFGILSGDRYEFFVHVDVDEEDELYNENGVILRALYIVEDQGERLSHYTILEGNTELVLDFELEDDELEQLTQFCSQHYHEALEERAD